MIVRNRRRDRFNAVDVAGQLRAFADELETVFFTGLPPRGRRLGENDAKTVVLVGDEARAVLVELELNGTQRLRRVRRAYIVYGEICPRQTAPLKVSH